jgi:hypothetical protein
LAVVVLTVLSGIVFKKRKKGHALKW